ncbi:ATP-binding protein [Wenjunlia tyrosinilytica]|uniref:ATP-binding protein n=1 Tax=Wenjunlia tyrosinilytica TaxID=1544741 RepID=UPI003570AF5F
MWAARLRSGPHVGHRLNEPATGAARSGTGSTRTRTGAAPVLFGCGKNGKSVLPAVQTRTGGSGAGARRRKPSPPRLLVDQDDAVAPNQGLARFESVDCHRFFGRDQLVADLLALVCRHRFTAVFGPSGSGKSSLLRASLPGPRAAVGDEHGPRVWRLSKRGVGAHGMFPGSAHVMGPDPGLLSGSTSWRWPPTSVAGSACRRDRS